MADIYNILEEDNELVDALLLMILSHSPKETAKLKSIFNSKLL